MAFDIEAMTKRRARAVVIDRAGNEVPLEGPLTWETTDANIINHANQADPEVDIQSPGPVGTATITVSGTNKNGEPIQGTADGNVIPGPGIAIRIDLGPQAAL